MSKERIRLALQNLQRPPCSNLFFALSFSRVRFLEKRRLFRATPRGRTLEQSGRKKERSRFTADLHGWFLSPDSSSLSLFSVHRGVKKYTGTCDILALARFPKREWKSLKHPFRIYFTKNVIVHHFYNLTSGLSQ